MSKFVNLTLLISLLISFSALSKEGETGWRNITLMGCHLTDGSCFIHIDGPAVGPENCKGNDIRFSVLDSPNGKIWLSLAQGAYVTEKQISFYIKGCYAKQPSYPTFTYGHINK